MRIGGCHRCDKFGQKNGRCSVICSRVCPKVNVGAMQAVSPLQHVVSGMRFRGGHIQAHHSVKAVAPSMASRTIACVTL